MITDDEFWYQARHEHALSESVFEGMLTLLHTRQVALAATSLDNSSSNNKSNKSKSSNGGDAGSAATTTTLAREEYRLTIAGMERLERAMGVVMYGDEWQKREDIRRQRARELLVTHNSNSSSSNDGTASLPNGKLHGYNNNDNNNDNNNSSRDDAVRGSTTSLAAAANATRRAASDDVDTTTSSPPLCNVAPVTMRVLQHVLLYAMPLHALRYNVPAMSMSERTSCCIDNVTRKLVTFGAGCSSSSSSSGHASTSTTTTSLPREPADMYSRGCAVGDGFVALLTDHDEVWVATLPGKNGSDSSNNNNSASPSGNGHHHHHHHHQQPQQQHAAHKSSDAVSHLVLGSSGNSDGGGGGGKNNGNNNTSSSSSGALASSDGGGFVHVASNVVALAARRERVACLTQQLTVRPLSSLVTPLRSVLPSRRVCFFDLGYGDDYYMVGVDGGTLYKTTASRRVLGTPRRVMTLSQRPVARVACGESFVALIDQSGRLLTMGRNKFGQLGCGRRNETRRAPYEHVDLRHHFFVQVAAGERHTLALTSSGVVYGTGSNEAGQLGLGSAVDGVCRFVPLPLSCRCIGIAAGPSASMFACDDGVVFACGDNTTKQLGVASEERYVYTPQPIPRLCDGVVSCTIDYGGFRRKTPSALAARSSAPPQHERQQDGSSHNNSSHHDTTTTTTTDKETALRSAGHAPTEQTQQQQQQQVKQPSATSSSQSTSQSTRTAAAAAAAARADKNNNNDDAHASRPPTLSASMTTTAQQQQQRPRNSNTSTPLLPPAAASTSASQLQQQQPHKRVSTRRSPHSVMQVHVVDDVDGGSSVAATTTTTAATRDALAAAALRGRAGDHEPITDIRYALAQQQQQRQASGGYTSASATATTTAKCGAGGCCTVM